MPAVAPPSVDDILGLLRGVIDPELGGNVVDLGMVPSVTVGEDGHVLVSVKLTISGCPLRAQIKKDVETRVGAHPGVTKVKIDWGEMTPDERSAVMTKARWNAKENASDTAVPANTRVLAIASGKGGVGKSSVTVNLAAAIAARGFTVGVLDADIWGFSVPRLLGMSDRLEAQKVEGSDRPMIIPGTGDVQMGLARMLPRTDMLIVTTPALAAQKVAVRAADMARRSFLRVAGVVENMSAFICDHGERYELFGRGGGQELANTIGAELLAQIPLEAAVAAGGDSGAPVAIEGDGEAARAFRRLAERLVNETIPPIALAGCSARMLDSIELTLGRKPATTA